MPSGGALFTFKHRVIGLYPSELLEGVPPIRVVYGRWDYPQEVEDAMLAFVPSEPEYIISLWKPEREMSLFLFNRLPLSSWTESKMGDTPVGYWDSVACGNCVRETKHEARRVLGNVEGSLTIKKVLDRYKNNDYAYHACAWALAVRSYQENVKTHA